MRSKLDKRVCFRDCWCGGWTGYRVVDAHVRALCTCVHNAIRVLCFYVPRSLLFLTSHGYRGCVRSPSQVLGHLMRSSTPFVVALNKVRAVPADAFEHLAPPWYLWKMQLYLFCSRPLLPQPVIAGRNNCVVCGNLTAGTDRWIAATIGRHLRLRMKHFAPRCQSVKVASQSTLKTISTTASKKLLISCWGLGCLAGQSAVFLDQCAYR